MAKLRAWNGFTVLGVDLAMKPRYHEKSRYIPRFFSTALVLLTVPGTFLSLIAQALEPTNIIFIIAEYHTLYLVSPQRL